MYIILEDRACIVDNLVFNNLADAEEYVFTTAQYEAFYNFSTNISGRLYNMTPEEWFEEVAEHPGNFQTVWGNIYDLYSYDLRIVELKEF